MIEFKVLSVLAVIFLLCGCKKHGRLGVGDDLDTSECAYVHLYDEKPTIMTSKMTKYTHGLIWMGRHILYILLITCVTS